MLELQNLCFQVSDDADKHKEIIRDVNLTFEDHAFIASVDLPPPLGPVMAINA